MEVKRIERYAAKYVWSSYLAYVNRFGSPGRGYWRWENSWMW